MVWLTVGVEIRLVCAASFLLIGIYEVEPACKQSYKMQNDRLNKSLSHLHTLFS